MAMRITGTFLDAVVADIPSNNWGPKEWAADFDAMKAVGIDTVILIRTGWKDRLAFDSQALRKHFRLMPVYEDQLSMFLDEAQRCGMDFYFGNFDSHQWRDEGGHRREIEANLALADEVMARCGSHPAFRGWYLTHEVGVFHEGAAATYETLARHLKGLKDVPTLISPWISGWKHLKSYLAPAEHEDHWDRMLSRVRGLVDVFAFQDGTCPFTELPAYLAANVRLGRKHRLRCWSNVETFERGDVHLKFLPIDWRHLRFKMEAAEAAGCEKLITFEFSHFMSPHSMYPSARNLYQRYRQWLDIGR
jgi:hypothetical protein